MNYNEFLKAKSLKKSSDKKAVFRGRKGDN